MGAPRWTSRRSTPRRWVPALAAAGATAIAAGSVSVLVYRSVHRTPTSSPVVLAAAQELVVRDGDEVQASGRVLITPGRPVRFCAPVPVAGVGRADGKEDPPDCSVGVSVIGVDPAKLSDVEEVAGSRVGEVQLRGIWRSGTLTVTQQSGRTSGPIEPEPSVPCAPPPGGWKKGQPDSQGLHQYIEEEHPDQFRWPWVAYPDGPPPDSATAPPAVEVLVVEMVDGDLDGARRELTSRYEGNLCVVSAPGWPSIADQRRLHDEVEPALDKLMRDQRNNIYASGGGDLISVEMLMLTPALYDEFAAIGLDAFDLEPWLRPVR